MLYPAKYLRILIEYELIAYQIQIFEITLFFPNIQKLMYSTSNLNNCGIKGRS